MSQNHSPAANFAPAGQNQLDRFGINPMFFQQDSRSKRFGGIVIDDRNDSLQDYRPAIEKFINEMHRTAAEFHPVVESFLLNVGAGKSRQQRRMNIQNTVWKSLEKNAAENPHETGKNDQRHVVLPKNGNDLGIEFLTGPVSRRNAERIQAASSRALQAASRFDVADDDGNFRPQFSGGDTVRDGFEIGTAAGEENAEPAVRRLNLHVR